MRTLNHAPTFKTTLDGIHWIVSHPEIRKFIKVRDNDDRVLLNSISTNSAIVDENTYTIDVNLDYEFLDESPAKHLDIIVSIQNTDGRWELLSYQRANLADQS